MLTWKLWRALRHPPVNHPLYRRVLWPRPRAGPSILEETAVLGIMWRLMSVILFVVIFALTPVLLASIAIAPILLLLMVNGFAIRCAIKAGSTIAGEQEQGTYETIALLPNGQLGAHWLICEGCLHSGAGFAWVHGVVRAILLFLASILGITGIITLILLVLSVRADRVVAIQALVSGAALSLAIYVEYIQSVVLGSLVGMLVPTYTPRRLDARLWGLVTYMTLQLATYLVAWLIGFVMLPALYQTLDSSGYSASSLTLLRLAVFYGAREGIIAVLWRLLLRRVNAVPSDVDVILSLP